jgi:hypothetical protein
MWRDSQQWPLVVADVVMNVAIKSLPKCGITLRPTTVIAIYFAPNLNALDCFVIC